MQLGKKERNRSWTWEGPWYAPRTLWPSFVKETSAHQHVYISKKNARRLEVRLRLGCILLLMEDVQCWWKMLGRQEEDWGPSCLGKPTTEPEMRGSCIRNSQKGIRTCRGSATGEVWRWGSSDQSVTHGWQQEIGGQHAEDWADWWSSAAMPPVHGWKFCITGMSCLKYSHHARDRAVIEIHYLLIPAPSQVTLQGCEMF